MTYKQLADKLNEMSLSTSIENTSRNNNQNEYRIINCRGKKNEKVKITKVILGEHYLENSIFDYKK